MSNNSLYSQNSFVSCTDNLRAAHYRATDRAQHNTSYRPNNYRLAARHSLDNSLEPRQPNNNNSQDNTNSSG